MPTRKLQAFTVAGTVDPFADSLFDPAFRPFYTLEEIVRSNPSDWPTHEETGMIVVGTVTGSESNEGGAGHLTLTHTVSTVQVEEVLKGDVVVGSEVFVVEAGGLHRPRIYLPQPYDAANPHGKAPLGGGVEGVDYVLGDPVVSTLFGIPLLAEGERYLLFLQSYDGSKSDVAYVAVQGAFQGKLKVNDQGVLEFPGPQEYLAAEELERPDLSREPYGQEVWYAAPAGARYFQLPARLQGCPLDEVAAGIRAILAGED